MLGKDAITHIANNVPRIAGIHTMLAGCVYSTVGTALRASSPLLVLWRDTVIWSP